MGMQNTADVLVGDQLRQRLLAGMLDLVVALAQLGRHERQAELGIDVFLSFGSHELAALPQAEVVELEAFLSCERTQGFDMVRRPGGVQQRRTIVPGVGEVHSHLAA
jgi:hypothetical protein